MRQVRQLGLDALDLGACRVVGEVAQARCVGLGDLQVRVVHVEHVGIEAEAVVEEVGLDADFVVLRFLRIERRRCLRGVGRRVVEAAALEAFRIREVREDLVGDRPLEGRLRRDLRPLLAVVRREARAFRVDPRFGAVQVATPVPPVGVRMMVPSGARHSDSMVTLARGSFGLKRSPVSTTRPLTVPLLSSDV